MKKSLFLAIFGLFLFSCTEVVFEQPQPPSGSALKSIPEDLRGQYSFMVLNEETLMEVGDTYITDSDDKAYLSDSLVMKKVGNKYVVSKLITEGPEEKMGKWNVYVLENKGCGFVKATTFVINSDTYVEPFNSAYNGTMIGQGQQKAIIINNNDDQFNTLLADDSVTVSIILERVK